MSPLAGTAVALAAMLLALAFGHVAPRLAPRWLGAARGPTWPLAIALVSAGLALPRLAGVDPLGALAARLGVARFGTEGAAAALALVLAALVALVFVAALVLGRRRDGARPPAGALGLLFGVAADGTSIEALRRPLRWGLGALALAALATLPLVPPPGPDPLAWALVVAWLVAGMNALARPAAALEVAAARAEQAPESDLHAAFHAALGHPPLVEREPALRAPATLAVDLAQAMSSDRRPEGLPSFTAAPRVVALAAPPGAGKRRAAEALAASYAARGLTTLWLEHLAAPDTSDTLAALAARRLGLVVIFADDILGEALAALRYGLHRLAAREGRRPDVLVLGSSPSVVASARAIAAAEPLLVSPAAFPTQPIQRFLLAHAPSPRLTATAPAATSFVPLDRPRTLARYPDAPGREYLVPCGGPRGRRMQEDRAASLTHGRASRLLVTLPGDRKSGDRPGEVAGELARHHLRAALAEAPQDLERLREVFSPRLVDDELASLTRTGLIVHTTGWAPSGARGIAPVARVAARLPFAAAAPRETIALVEPRSGRRREVSKARADLDYYDGAIVSLEGAAGTFEVRIAPDGSRALVPSALLSATPLRTLTFRPAEAPAKTRLRFRGVRELEVWEGAVDLEVLHRGVRQFGQPGPAALDAREAETRAFTRLLAEPAHLRPIRTWARLLLVDASRPALHTIAHALREVLPCFFDNAADVGVSYVTPADPLGRAALVLYDAHPAGLGAVADLRDDNLEALLVAAVELLECDCAAHCAACCESTSCSEVEVPLNRHEALKVLQEIALPRPIPLATGPRAHAALLRRTG